MSAGSVEAILRSLYEAHGRLDPYLVVDEARSSKSPLHSRFTWDNSAAADQWRLQQARALIRSVTIERVITPDEPARIVRAFVHDPKNDGYISVTDVAKRVDLRERVLEDMRRDLDRLKKKWSLYDATLRVLAAEILAAEPEEGQEAVGG